MRLLQLFTLLFMGLGSAFLRAQVNPPTISPTHGDSVLAFDAELSGEPNTQVHYTTNGLAPSQDDTNVGQNGTVRIVTNTELKARAINQAGQQSSVVSANYRITGAVSLSGQFALLLTSYGKVFSWGDGATGKLGNGSSANQLRPVEVIKGAGKFEDAVSISAGASHSLVADQAGFVWSFGAGSYHRLGYNSLSNTSTPVRVLKSASATDHLTNIVEVAAARYSSYALDGQGFVWAWGHRGNGRLGEGSTSGNQSFAVSVTLNATGNGTGNGTGGNGTTFPLLSGIEKIAASEATALALGQNQLVYGWGFNGNGQLCQGHSNSSITRAVPLRLNASNVLDGAIDISVGGQFIAVVRQTAQEAGTVWTCGAGSLGQLGNGTNPAGGSTYPVRVIKADGQPLTNIIQVAAGYWHALALDQSGQVWAWGHNNRGQLGDGTTTNRNVAVPVTLSSGGNLTGIVYISAAGFKTGTANFSTSMAISQNGTLFAWGANNEGQFGNGTTSGTNTRALPAGNGTFASPPPPTVTLTVSGPPYVSPATITLNASATSLGSTTAKVDFFHNGSVNSDMSSPYQAQVTGLTPGQHTFHAVVTNALGARANSSTLQVEVRLPSLSVSTIGSPLRSDSTQPAKFRIQRESANSGALLVNYSLTGSAEAGVHFHTISPSSATIPAGSAWVDVEVFPIAIYGNEPARSLTLTIAPGAGYTVSSGSGTLTIGQAPLLSFWPRSGSITDVRVIKFLLPTPGATIRYTTNGTAPSLSSPAIAPNELMRIPLGTTTIRAYATAPGFQDSPVATAVYTGKAQVHAGDDFSVAINQGGQVFSWGRNNAFGQLGRGHTRAEFFPGQVEAPADAISASAGQNHFVYALANGSTFGKGWWPGRSGGNGFIEVSARKDHSLALSTNGTVFGWGNNESDQVGLPLGGGSSNNPYVSVPRGIAGTSNFQTIAAGGNHSLGINAQGQVMGWGSSSDGQLGHGIASFKTSSPVLSDMVAAVQVSAGDCYSLALSKNGTVWSAGEWENLRNGRVSGSTNSFRPIPNLNDVVKISAGFSHALALKSNGTVVGWGDNSQNQLSSSNSSNSTGPLPLPGITNAIDISAGRNHSLILLADGSVIMLGKDSRPNPINLATKAAMPKVSQVSGHHTSPIGVTVTNLQSGAALYYTLDGSEPTEDSQSIATGGTIQVSQSSILKVKAFAPGMAASPTVSRVYTLGGRLFAGGDSSFYLSSGGEISAFGLNNQGQLGLGNFTAQSSPVALASLVGIREIAAGTHHTLFLSQNGTVYSTGNNTFGCLGNNSTVSSSIPVQVEGLNDVVSLALSANHSLALRSNGAVMAWGRNDRGQLGDGTGVQKNKPVAVSGLTDIIQIAAGENASMAINSAGELFVWGGQSAWLGLNLGDGWDSFHTPVRCGNINDLVFLSATYRHVLGLRRDGSLWSAGEGARGKLGLGTTDSQSSFLAVVGGSGFTSCSAGTNHSLAVDSSHKLWAFGNLENGRLGLSQYGDGNITNAYSDNGFIGRNQTTPQQVPLNLPVFSAVAAGAHSVATTWNGVTTFWAWGNGTSGQIGDGGARNRYVPVMLNFNTYADTDGDGLPDWQEYSIGSAHNKTDSNGSGLDDYTEWLSGISPSNLSLTGNMTNAEKLAQGLNPFLADTDGDGVDDHEDAFPFDPERHLSPPPDSAPPVILILQPQGASLAP